MAASSARILLAGPGKRLDRMTSALEEAGLEVVREEEATAAALAGVDLLVLDFAGREESVASVVRSRRLEPLVSVVVVSSEILEGETLLALGRAGAYDCLPLPDPAGAAGLVPRLEAAMKRSEHRRGPHPVGERILGRSDKMSQVRRYIRQAAMSSANVLLLGETGTGKELAARAIHEAGPRAGGPFVAVNCAAIPETLLESELFGHERGSFTGADRLRRGAFEVADGGTLFLDEAGEMPAAFQAKILRVLQAPPGAEQTVREFARVGGERPLRADVRVIAATNTDLGEAAEQGRYRKDLLERLQVIAVRMPPLRERRADIDELAIHFLNKYCRQEDRPRLKVDAAALQVLRAFDYPGNVRELESAMRSVVSLKEAGDTLVLGDLPLKFFQSEETVGADPSPLLSLAELEKRHVTRVLQATAGNKARAARILGISRPTLDRKIQRHDIRAASFVTRQ